MHTGIKEWAKGALLSSLLLITACASETESEYVERPAEDLYSEGEELLDRRRFNQAASRFEEIERQHPYSQLAIHGKLKAAFAYYEAQNYIEAVATLENFIDLHPGNENVPYAQYLIARSYYDQISDVGRDQKMTLEAVAAFDELIRRYPDTDYAKDAKLKIDLANDHLAGKEMEIGRYYQRKGNYLSAINRFRSVVDFYQTTSHVPEALHRLTESYLALGVVDEAMAAAATLGHNYPDNRWYARSYALINGEPPPSQEGGGWLSGIFGAG